MRINQSVIATDGGVRATWAEVNLTRLEHNLAAIKRRVAPAKMMLIVKANAYGHGLAEVSKALAGKTDYVGVAVLEEGMLLRELGVTAPIIVLGGIWGDQILLYLKNDLTLTASSVERLEQIDAVAGQMGVKAKVHLKIDTGMERIGIHYYSASLLQEAALKCKHVEVESIRSLNWSTFRAIVCRVYPDWQSSRTAENESMDIDVVCICFWRSLYHDL